MLSIIPSRSRSFNDIGRYRNGGFSLDSPAMKASANYHRHFGSRRFWLGCKQRCSRLPFGPRWRLVGRKWLDRRCWQGSLRPYCGPTRANSVIVELNSVLQALLDGCGGHGVVSCVDASKLRIVFLGQPTQKLCCDPAKTSRIEVHI